MATTKPLTAAQREYVSLLAAQIERAEHGRDKAQAALDGATHVLETVQGSANTFLAYCANELGFRLDDTWRFDQAAMAFVQVAKEESE